MHQLVKVNVAPERCSLSKTRVPDVQCLEQDSQFHNRPALIDTTFLGQQNGLQIQLWVGTLVALHSLYVALNLVQAVERGVSGFMPPFGLCFRDIE